MTLYFHSCSSLQWTFSIGILDIKQYWRLFTNVSAMFCYTLWSQNEMIIHSASSVHWKSLWPYILTWTYNRASTLECLVPFSCCACWNILSISRFKIVIINDICYVKRKFLCFVPFQARKIKIYPHFKNVDIVQWASFIFKVSI